MKRGDITEGMKKETALFLFYLRTTFLIRRVDTLTTRIM